MKLRVIATLVAVLAFGAGSASAQSIGIFADLGSASCNVSIAGNGSFYVNVIGSGALNPSGITGAEFRLDVPWTDGVDALLFTTPNAASNVDVGSSILNGKNIAFPACQVGPSVNLYTLTLIINVPANVDGSLLSILQHTTPSNANFQCPVVVMCDGPTFTSVCVPGGQAYVNGTTDCTVAVEEKTWSEVKNLYN